MSKIYFHSENGEAAVSGSERFHMAALVSDTATDILLASPDVRQALRLFDDDERSRNLIAGAAIGGRVYTVGQQEFEMFSLVLNTALERGPDTVRLAARLHGQCEIHAYVEGSNRAWLADLIERACEEEVFRYNLTNYEGVRHVQGWENVIAFLRAANNAPVVTSYSVTEGFPDLEVVREFSEWVPVLPDGLDEDDRQEAYYEAWENEPRGWDIAMDALRRANSLHHLELGPDGFSEFRFDDGASASSLIEAARMQAQIT